MKKTARKNRVRTAVKILAMCLWVVLAVIAAQLVVGNILILIVGREGFSRPVWTAIYSALSYIVAMGLIIAVPPLFRWRKLNAKYILPSREELGLKDLPTWTDIGLAPVGFIVSLLLAAALVWVFSFFPWFDANQAQDVGFNMYMNGGDKILAFLTLVVVAPIAEEVIFRGWLYGKLRARLSGELPQIWSIIISIFITSLVFGLVHFQWNVGVNVFALSIVLCILREITGTTYAGMLTHMIKNGVAFYLLYVLGVV